MTTAETHGRRPGEASPIGAGRALGRMAVRNTRRHLRRSLLIVALLAVPVAAAVVVAAGQRALFASSEEQTAWHYGQSDHVLQSTADIPFGVEVTAAAIREYSAGYGVEIEDARTLLEWARDADPTVFVRALGELSPEVQVASNFRTGTSIGPNYLDIRGMDPTLPVNDGIVTLRSGTWPGAISEVTLTPRAARWLHVEIGDTVSIDTLGEVTVTGLHDINADARSFGVVARPDALPVGSPVDHLISGLGKRTDVKAEVLRALTREAGPEVAEILVSTGSVYIAETDSFFGFTEDAPLRIDRPPVLAGFVAAALLVEVGLVAAAAHATGARRRLREFGLLATLGAEPSHIRRIVLLEAGVLGVFGVALGCVAGIVATTLLEGPISNLPTHVVTDVGARWSDLVAPVIVGFVAALIAAWWPARMISKVAVLSALAGRVPTRPLRGSAVPRAAGLLVVGLIALALGSASARYDHELSDAAVVLMLGGCLLILAGAALAGTWVVGRVASSADRFPLTLRLVVRDAGRQQFRSAMAVAGLVVILAAPVGVAAAVVTAEADGRASFVPEALADEILVHHTVEPGEPIPPLSAAAFEAINAVAPARVVGGYQRLGVDTPGDGMAFVWVVAQSGEQAAMMAVLGSPEAVAALRLPQASQDALDRGELVTLGGVLGEVHLQIPGAEEIRDVTLNAVAAPDRPWTFSAPAYVMPMALATDLGLVPLDATTVLLTDEPVSSEDRDRILALSGSDSEIFGNMRIAVGQEYNGFSTRVQVIALPVALVVVLVIGGCLVAIAATESDRDVTTMRRVGAAPSLRRRFLGTQGWYHAALGAVLGAPVGLLMLVALRQVLLDPPPLRMPWMSVIGVVVAIPVLLGIAVATVVRSAPLASLAPVRGE